MGGPSILWTRGRRAGRVMICHILNFSGILWADDHAKVGLLAAATAATTAKSAPPQWGYDDRLLRGLDWTSRHATAEPGRHQPVPLTNSGEARLETGKRREERACLWCRRPRTMERNRPTYLGISVPRYLYVGRSGLHSRGPGVVFLGWPRREHGKASTSRCCVLRGGGAHRSGQEPTWLPAFSASICCCPWQVAAAGFCGLLGYRPLSGFRFRSNQQRLRPIRQSGALLRCPFPSLLAAFGEFPLTCLPVDCNFLQPPATDCIRHSARNEPDPLGIRRCCKLFRDAEPSAGSTPTEGPSATTSELQVHARRAAIGQAAGRFCL